MHCNKFKTKQKKIGLFNVNKINSFCISSYLLYRIFGKILINFIINNKIKIFYF